MFHFFKFKKIYYKVTMVRDLNMKNPLIYCSYNYIKVSENLWKVKHFGISLEVVNTSSVFPGAIITII
jgi:hypothetical protein